jgi:hypothetical protein
MKYEKVGIPAGPDSARHRGKSSVRDATREGARLALKLKWGLALGAGKIDGFRIRWASDQYATVAIRAI